MKKPLLYLFPVIIILTSCGASNIRFNVLAPAPNDIPQRIQSLAIIDRSIPKDADLNLIEGILTMEGAKQDIVATQVVLDGLKESLESSTRYEVTRTAEAMVGSGSGVQFPAPLDWTRVEELCVKYSSDAIVSLETFDSDFIVTSGTRTGERLLEFYARGLATVNCGFRMYDPQTKSIIDEFHFSHNMDWDVGGLSVITAIETLLSKDAAIKEASFNAGIMYGQRITPTWIRVSRDYFRKGSYELEEGARMMELNDWDKAIEALNRALLSGNVKSKGRSAHNLAVVYEILGDLHTAKEWTSEAWGRYKEKRSRDYGYILTRRIQEQEVLNYQLDRD